MAKKIITLSIDEEIIKLADDIVVKNREFQNRSHFISTLVVRYAKIKNKKDKEL